MLLRAVGIEKRFGDAFALSGVSIEARDGDRPYALVGPNGSGKTSLLNVIDGSAALDAGTITVADVDVSRWQQDRRARFGIRRSFQGATAFDSLSVERNARLVLSSPSRLEVLDGPRHELLDRALAEFELDTVRHHDASQISYGQRKMLSLLMATIRPFKLLLLDEPVAGLQPRFVELVANLIAKMDGIIMVVEHNFEFIERLGAHVLFLAGGQLIESGSLRDVLAAPAVRRAYS